jgi:aminoglycoside phosphotransferase (APT) family kinase protein
MSDEARHRIQFTELRDALELVLGQRVKQLRRRLSAYSSSYTVENLDVITVRGQRRRLVLKDVSPPSVLATAQQVRPHFLYHPAREIEVYEKILNRARCGAARCHGAVNSPELERHWLFLERVEGRLLWQTGDLSEWDAAARWLAEFHQGFARKKFASVKTLLAYDEQFFGVWIERAEKFLKKRNDVQCRKFARLSKNYARVAGRLAALPQNFIHGEFYASNVIVRDGSAPKTICPIDWELAGVGPTALDLAALTAGEWSETEKLRFVTAYREALSSRHALSLAEMMQAVVLCQLHLSVQMLGWAEDWAPPEKHAQNWLQTALRLADKLGLA